MLCAALMSRSCSALQAHLHSLIRRPSRPEEPVRFLQTLQVTVEYASTSPNHTQASSHLYCSMVRNALQPASNIDLAIRVLARPEAFTQGSPSCGLQFWRATHAYGRARRPAVIQPDAVRDPGRTVLLR